MTILKTLLYFSIFKHPLTHQELFEFSKTTSINELNIELKQLLNQALIYRVNDYYTLKGESEIKRRIRGAFEAKKIMPKAIRRAKFISKFPFVESVSLSGALAKGYYDGDGDIDFFIITKPKVLWISRSLLILYKKIVLLNSKKYFCVNYFISSDFLEIEEKNQFTATELLTLIPITGKTVFKAFIKENEWAKNYLPNKKINKQYAIENVSKPVLTKILEVVFSSVFGDFLNASAQMLTIKKWQSKFNYLSKDEFEIAMKSTKNVSKHHPQNFQKKVITLWNEKINQVRPSVKLNLVKENA